MATSRRRAREIDTLDTNIIRLLQADARRPNTEIARRLGVAEATVRHRIDRLIRDGVVQCGAWTDPLKIGYQTYAIVQIQVDPPRLEQVAEAVARFPEVFFLGVTTGAFDVVAAAVFRSNEHLYELMTRRLSRIAGIERTSTLGIVRIVKRAYTYPIPGLDQDGAAPVGTTRAGAGPPSRRTLRRGPPRRRAGASAAGRVP